MRPNTRARRRRSNTILLVATFAIGILMGFGLCFALVAIAGFNFSGEAPPAPPVEAPAPPAISPTTEVPAPAPTVAPETPKSNEGEAAPAITDPSEEELVYPDASPVNTPNNVPRSATPTELPTRFADVKGLWPARHLAIGLEGTTLDDDTASLIHTYKPGGVVLEEHNIQSPLQLRALILDIKKAAGFGDLASDVPLIMIEQDGGAIGNPLKLRPSPTPAELAAVGDLEEVTATAEAYSAAAAELGFGVFLGPSVDVYREGKSNPEFATQSFGEDTKTLSLFGLAFAEGVLNRGLIPVAKHFPGIGTGHINKSGLYVLDESEETGLAKLMFPFADLANRRVPGILVSHVAVPALEDIKPAPPASLSEKLIKGVMREMWGYDGVVIADDFTLHPAVSELPLAESVVQSLSVGVDAVILLRVDAQSMESVCEAITNAVIADKITPEALANSKARLDVWHMNIAEGLGAGVSHNTPPRVVRPGATIQPVKSAPEAAPLETPQEIPPAAIAIIAPAEATVKTIKHRIEKGESLDVIAKKYGVTVKDLMTWNNLKDGNIKFGYSLIVNVPTEVEAEAVVEPVMDEGAEATPTPEPIPEATPAPEATPEPEVVVNEVDKVDSVDEGVKTTPSVETPAPEPTHEPEPVVDEVDKVDSVDKGTEATPVPEAVVEVPAPEPMPAPEPVVETPAPEPMPTPVPEAVVEAPAPEPVVEAPAPEPVVETPAPEPMPTPEAGTAAIIVEEPATEKTFIHKVESGESLTVIANKYGVSISDLTKWNNLKESKIVIGAKLKVQAASDKVPADAEIVPEGIEETIPEVEAAPEPVVESEPVVVPELDVDEVDKVDGVDKGTEAVVETPAPELTPDPVVETPAPEPTPEPEAVVEEPAPSPTPELTPEPVVETPAPQPTPEPVVETPAPEPTPEPEPVPVEEVPAPTPVTEAPAPPAGAVATKYKIVPGDTLFGISKKLNIPVGDLKEWNKLEDGNIKHGQTLTIYGDGVAPSAETVSTPPPPSQTPDEAAISSVPAPAPIQSGEQPTGTIKYTHTVRIEQNLEGIATAYEVSAEDIRKWNNLSSADISEGQELVIYMPE